MGQSVVAAVRLSETSQHDKNRLSTSPPAQESCEIDCLGFCTGINISLDPKQDFEQDNK